MHSFNIQLGFFLCNMLNTCKISAASAFLHLLKHLLVHFVMSCKATTFASSFTRSTGRYKIDNIPI